VVSISAMDVVFFKVKKNCGLKLKYIDFLTLFDELYWQDMFKCGILMQPQNVMSSFRLFVVDG